METTSTTIIKTKFTICLSTSFLGLCFIILILFQGWGPDGFFFDSLQVLQSPTTSKPDNLPTNNTFSSPPNAPSPSQAQAQPQMDVSTPLQEDNNINNNNNSMTLTLDGGGEGDNSPKECNIFEGNWIHDPESYPLYHAKDCPYLSDQVSCIKNGRPDSDYELWRWQPSGCDIPRFNGTTMLEMLRGKRVALVGDSINRNMWESLSCMLYTSIPPSRAIVDASQPRYKVLRALDYDCEVEFYWSPFIIPLDITSFGDKKVLRLDSLPETSLRWQNVDVLVFNTGHWWTHRGATQKWDLYEVNGTLVEEMEKDEPFKRALKTLTKWLGTNVDPNKTTVFFRSISPEHKGVNWCYNQTEPITNETYIQWFPKSMIEAVQNAMSESTSPVNYLNITHLSEYRKDGHTAVYTVRQNNLLTLEERMQPKKYADCSHWCLPGLPDTWNVLIYATLFKKFNFQL